ncbi:MAG: CO dehydrogenase/CO-methylating acetyl-CoA synthase complex subunit beta, partial [Candidatus Bathyarchaeia archaeon]
RIEHKFELVRARDIDEVEDGKVTIIGPDIKDLKESASHPFGLLIEVAGKEVEEGLEGVIERRIHEYINFIEGFMHLNQRYDIHLRMSKKSFKRGFNSFTLMAKVLERLFKSELPFIEKIQFTFITDPEKVKGMWEEAIKVYDARDARARGLKDEEVDAFYGCTLCQSFAPTHVCIITPQRYANCGAISWFDGRASARVDPKGPVFSIERGDLLDPVKGEFSGVNAAAKEKTLGEITKVWLYTAFGYPHTSCGCFEATAFYIPEVDGFGVVHRDFKGPTVNGLPFSTMADSTAGGRQVDGFHGVSIEYMRSPKFLQTDGGGSRVVWVPAAVMERVKDFIPEDLVGKVATERDVETVEQLREFLKERGHPVVEGWEAIPVEVEAKEEEAALMPSIPLTGVPVAGGGLRIILKDAKIVAKKVIIRSVKKGG